MGQVLLTFEIMPNGLEVDLDTMRKGVETKISGFCKIEQVEIKPIAFGLKALMMNIVVEDEEGMMDRVEAEIGSVEGVQSARVFALNKI
ncbi:MAG: elongation factor 1-beta [Candidatus Thermoplasmatota archaeon]|nr:elongation factor 1-beta [Euryarchaeota archaeon]MBU4032837.1 elongation factor 1-beta [Candidatus Thermoplasmatota archaeon]MBU4070980.1 elongation factor 1-beta [Candidatus Thermoplasmatota archaeon]MBU4145218.1 elongation factor 1-beta [Candidatus Thermoplasmatota archaeon]MBU4591042.1 elongation factor 1-beta [Candidatus Thermoplasmatota archaeon]